MQEEISLFIPGRLAILGELSDWVSDYKKINNSIIPGETIAAGINKGIYAVVKKSETFNFCYNKEAIQIKMENRSLEKIAKSSNFYSYVASVALYMNKNYNVSGIDIKIRYMTLPIKKGLSSSAAVSVLTAKAFNIIYNLNLQYDEIMKIAYEAERYALSKCGRLDQICAKGLKVSHLIFNEDNLEIKSIEVKKNMNYVIADLNGKKDTKKILSSLHSCFPFPKNETQEKVKQMLCEENKKIVHNGLKAIENGNLEELGKIMNKYQELISKHGGEICDDLKAPKLNLVINDEKIKSLSYGAKGIGSNGDGAIEILAKNEVDQEEIIKYLKKQYNMESFKIKINKTHKIKKAVIPVAGYGTRVYPFTRIIKKAFLPIVEGEYVKPLILKLVEELDDAGIEEILFVIEKKDEQIYREFFKKPLSEEYFEKLSDKEKEYELNIQRIGEKISFVVQEELLGYGHAVYLSKEFANNEPVLMILGDTIYKSKSEQSCIDSVLSYYDEVNKPIVSLHEIEEENLKYYGIVQGNYIDLKNRKVLIKEIIEKPSLEFAREKLKMKDKYLGTFGISVINSLFFNVLEEKIKKHNKNQGEIQFTDAIHEVAQKTEVIGYIPNGIQYDLGNAKAYKEYFLKNFKTNKRGNNE